MDSFPYDPRNTRVRSSKRTRLNQAVSQSTLLRDAPRVSVPTTKRARTVQAAPMPTGATRHHTKADKRVSCREYYCYKLQHRPNNMLLPAGRCLQQYIVDMYVKIENTRLDFFRNNQDTIRADLYQGILDTLDSGENSAANVGKRVVLRRYEAKIPKCHGSRPKIWKTGFVYHHDL